MKKLNIPLILVLVAFLVGCNLPKGTATQSSPDAVFTQAAETVAAQLTQIAVLASPTPNIPTSTPTPEATDTPFPTNTTAFTPTNTPIPCNLAGFIADVTVPDNTVMSTNQTFTKTWRLRNNGTCTWTSVYSASFLSGDGMGVSAGYSQSLTSVPIPPGGTVDISVNLTAPATTGTYTGRWSIKEPGGLTFGTNFIVKIQVVKSTSLVLTPLDAESGMVCTNVGPLPDFVVGESDSDITKSCQVFFSFDISSLPGNAKIVETKLDLTHYTINGSPFGSLGVLNLYAADFGPTLELTDFVNSFPNGNIEDWGSTGALDMIEASPELKSLLQSMLGKGRLQVRLQFAGSNNDAVKDQVTFAAPKLALTYTQP